MPHKQAVLFQLKLTTPTLSRHPGCPHPCVQSLSGGTTNPLRGHGLVVPLACARASNSCEPQRAPWSTQMAWGPHRLQGSIEPPPFVQGKGYSTRASNSSTRMPFTCSTWHWNGTLSLLQTNSPNNCAIRPCAVWPYPLPCLQFSSCKSLSQNLITVDYCTDNQLAFDYGTTLTGCTNQHSTSTKGAALANSTSARPLLNSCQWSDHICTAACIAGASCITTTTALTAQRPNPTAQPL